MAKHSFQEVMHQFDRMCNANSGCINCPLHQKDYECHVGAFVRYPEKIERTVMQWAAEHPEPKYPTWREYLNRLRLGDIGLEYEEDAALLDWDIPADIAEKLGIEPKDE